MPHSVLNFNVGVLGHIDSGKTSLSKALSTIASTASFDKNPQSRERGITLDLGFSSFTVPIPDHIKAQDCHLESLQFTLVDCPGHASLIRTIIGGAQIIDLMMLVVDITKGVQTQTAECLVLGEITCNHMIVILNKIDLLPDDKREASIQKMSKKILKTLERTKFKNSVIIPVSAKPNSDETNAVPIGIDSLVECLKHHTYIPERSPSGSFVFAVDHCFAIKGQGTVMTGTILQGQVSVSDVVEIPKTKITRKVKSIQMFKKPIQTAMQGDRVGICVTQFDPKDLERGVVCSPGYIETTDSVIASVSKIPYFKGVCKTGSKFHVSIMHDTVISKCSFFAPRTGLGTCLNEFNFDLDYVHLDEIPEESSAMPSVDPKVDSIFALLQLANPVILNKDAVYIASRLETDIHANVCRLAFHGKILAVSSSKQNSEIFPTLKVYKEKMKVGTVDRMVNEYQVIVRDLFKKETNIQIFANLKVLLSTGEEGIIEGSFGQSGKVNVRVPNGLSEKAISSLKISKKGKRDQIEKDKLDQITVELKFKKYIYGNKKKIFQSK
ncbi:selenocysteine-specific elongation factor-like [Uloborus diversus]|uniref:selenocysteine-specific elongation factor-like n=1 Tax=Uloborus diversus TaxID=327109 RepID=UPI00240902EA|nr:selenocysteine-specific elongation factor-like [Uloborus diversus]